MSPRETLVNETREWLERSRADLNACDALIAAGLAAEALFHAQQCAEKAMKALLTWRQVSFKKTHEVWARSSPNDACPSLEVGLVADLAES